MCLTSLVLVVAASHVRVVLLVVLTGQPHATVIWVRRQGLGGAQARDLGDPHARMSTSCPQDHGEGPRRQTGADLPSSYRPSGRAAGDVSQL
jgi:hypothetical protein